MRKFLAILVCKLIRFVGSFVGRGSSLPGQIALKICPDILQRVQLPPEIIAVTGPRPSPPPTPRSPRSPRPTPSPLPPATARPPRPR